MIRRKLFLGIGMFGIAAPLYLVPNHFPLITPYELPFTWIDRRVPFVPESIWVYLSEFPMIITAFFLVKNEDSVRQYLRSLVWLLALSAVVFFVFPTTYPRHLFPLPSTMDAASRFLFELQRAGDTPNNCFPSLHVATVFLAALSLKGHSKLFGLYLFWAILISFSTLTTKQHYAWDILGGFILALLFNRRFNLTETKTD